MKIIKKQYLIFLIFGLLIFLPIKANADALEGLGEAIKALITLLIIYGIIAIISFLLAIDNIKKKKKRIRIFNWIVLTPVVVGSLYSINFFPLNLFLLTWNVLHLWIISKSYPRAEEEREENI